MGVPLLAGERRETVWGSDPVVQWLFRSGEDGLPEIILYGYFPYQERHATQESFWKATADIWKRTAIRVITVCPGSGAAPVGHISADTLSTLFPKGSSMTTASLQYRESSTAIGCLPWKTPLTKSIPVIMKSGNNCVSRRKNLFWRLSGRGLTSKKPVRNTRLDKSRELCSQQA